MNKKGFTLLEIMAVIALLAVLVIFAVPNIISTIKESKKNAFLSEAKTVFEEATNTYTTERTEGNKISLVSNEVEDGTKLSLSNGEELKYTIFLDDKGKVTSFKLYNQEYCLIGMNDFLDNATTDDIIELLAESEVRECKITDENGEEEIFQQNQVLTMKLNIKAQDLPVTQKHDIDSMILKYKVGWYKDKKSTAKIDKINTKPQKDGAYFKGFAVNNDYVIDCNGKLTVDNRGITTTGAKIFPNLTTSTVTANAVFAKKNYAIKYYPKEGSEEGAYTKTYDYGVDTYKVDSNPNTVTGKKFLYWEEQGTINRWNAGAPLPNMDKTKESNPLYSRFTFSLDGNCATKSLVFKAKYEYVDYKVTLVSKHKDFNATISKNEITVRYGGTYSDLPNPTIAGYTFDGWYTDATGGTKVNKTDTVTKASDHTLYAHYKPNKYGLDINPDYNLYGTNYGAGSRVQSFDLKIVSEDGATLYEAKNISDYCSAGTCGGTKGEYNATYYITNVKYRDEYKYKDNALRSDSAHEASNLPVTPNAAGTTFTFKHSHVGDMWFSINTSGIAKFIFSYTGKFSVDDGGTVKSYENTEVNVSNDNWKVKLLTSGTFKAKMLNTEVDAFLVGGGGSGGCGDGQAHKSGGGGGYTNTAENLQIALNTNYAVTIGAGGRGKSDGTCHEENGGTTTAFSFTAPGGSHGTTTGYKLCCNEVWPYDSYACWGGPEGYNNSGLGANGGSGSGGAGGYNHGGYTPGNGGSNGGAGSKGTLNASDVGISTLERAGGTGCSTNGGCKINRRVCTNTREFCESSGTLYSGGGGSLSCRGDYCENGLVSGTGGSGGGANGEANGGANTGGGGGGAKNSGKGAGGSGIVVLRNSTKYNWYSEGGNLYCKNASGTKLTNTWAPRNGKSYYLDNTGKMWKTEGWKQINSVWYYFRSDGSIIIDETVKLSNGKWYVFDVNGNGKSHVNEYVVVDKKTYNGGKDTYFFGADGERYTNQWLVRREGEYNVLVKKCFDDNGIMVRDWWGTCGGVYVYTHWDGTCNCYNCENYVN